MSWKSLSRSAAKNRSQAATFAALGDTTRLSIVANLAHGRSRSISQLTHGTRLTRQAITKHLRVLETAGIVRGTRTGRESLFTLDPTPLEEMRAYLGFVSKQWDQALARLKSFVEDSGRG
ncbi:MAG TPA: metalloregulator ArsR/SmtB family transcription factor [Candidatus Acidoferrales bacterium]|jgi:DNA-binding transcriptional ArsR family regulator|nr:metalloregulator ArsR/SmtB family transcription factor [Candidatus Acidoferrales bacterium]